jgi:fructose-1-phosphate kinase PfkB-like protein
MNLRRPVIAMSSVGTSGTAPIIVVGLNGALQKRFVLPPNEKLVPGNVLRAEQVQTGVGGKGQDVSIALNCLSPSKDASFQQLAQFVGRGSAGDAVYQMLVEQLGESSMGLTVRSSSEMRTCTSIVAADETTELVEPSGVITQEELLELSNKVSKVMNQAKGLCIMGSMPPGCPPETYAQIYSRVAGPSTVCVVDSLAGIDALIQTACEMDNDSGPIVFKVNASELCKLAGTSKSNSEVGGVVMSELTEAVQQFVAKYSTKGSKPLLGLAITDGRHPAYFASLQEDEDFKLYQLPVAKLDSGRLLYPIGAGDAVAAGTLAAWVSLKNARNDSGGDSPIESIVPEECLQLLLKFGSKIEKHHSSPEVSWAVSAFAFGLVCGTASCLQEENSVLDIADVKRLFVNDVLPKLVYSKPMAEA